MTAMLTDEEREAAKRIVGGRLTFDDAEMVARALLAADAAVRGMREALTQLELNEAELWGIRDDYIVAQYSGIHGGRHIKSGTARQYARDFGERADSAKQCTDLVRAAIEKATKP